MRELFHLFYLFLITTIQICTGMHPIISGVLKTHNPLPLILKKGEYSFPQKFYENKPESRKTNKEGEKLTFFCPGESKEEKMFDKYCLVPVEDTNSSCKHQIKPILVKSNELDIRCGMNRKSVYYDFIFRLCLPDENAESSNDTALPLKAIDLLMYRICYNTDKLQTIFTYHRIISPNLLQEEFSKNERQISYSLDINDYDLPKNTFKHIKTTFSNLNGTFLKKFSKNEDKFNHLKELLLVSPNHMVYSPWKIPVHHYINVKPAWDFVIEAWNKINSFYENIIQDTEFIQISGTKDVWESKDQTIYLDDAQTTTIPKYFWKLVYIPAKKALSLVILHNIPEEEFHIKKLCEANDEEQIHRITSTKPKYVYHCDPNIITDVYGLPEELDLLLKKEYFSPLVLSYSNGIYNFPISFHGFRSPLDGDNQVLFCPPVMEETEIYDKSCLIRNDNKNPYCMTPVIPNLVDSHDLVTKYGFEKENSAMLSIGFKLCFKNDQVGNITDDKTEDRTQDIEIYNVVVKLGNTSTFYEIISPRLLFNLNLENERALDYMVEVSTTKTTIVNYKTVPTIFTDKKQYMSPERKILTQIPLVSPYDMAFSTWKNSVYLNHNLEFAWSEIIEIWNIINRQLQIQAIEMNQQLIHINGTMKGRIINDLTPKSLPMIPTYLWKVVYTPDMQKNIAIIVHNEKDKTNVEEKLCEESICDMSQWNFGSSSNLPDFAYCCNAEMITQQFNLPKASETLKIKNYYLPLIFKKSTYESYFVARTYDGLNNLKERQKLFCPAETKEDQKFNSYCLVPNETPFPYCRKPVEPFLRGSSLVSTFCGGDEDAYEFNFEYKACVEDDISGNERGNNSKAHIANIYTICFNAKKQETIYTFHSIKSTALLHNPKLLYERHMSYELRDDNFNLHNIEFTILKENIYKTLYKFNNSYVTHHLVPLLLVSPYDMAFALLKKPTHHYINVKPSFEKVVKIWDSINTQIRNIAMNETSFYSQKNGFLDYLEIDGKALYLNDNTTKLPNAFWKFVYFEHQSSFSEIAIIVHNVPDEKYISKKYCEENICKNNSELSFLASHNNMVYCCDATNIKQRLKFSFFYS